MGRKLRQVRSMMGSGLFWRAALVVYAALVYGHSMIPAEVSSQESGAVLAFLSGLMNAVHLPGNLLTEHMVRKSAHFLEYMGMGALLYVNFQIMARQRREAFKVMALLAVWLPFVDETIQLFVRGRSGQISDVWLDMAGLWAGIGFLWLSAGRLNGRGSRRR